MGEEQHMLQKLPLKVKAQTMSSSLQFFHFQDHEWWCYKIAEIGTPESHHHEAW